MSRLVDAAATELIAELQVPAIVHAIGSDDAVVRVAGIAAVDDAITRLMTIRRQILDGPPVPAAPGAT